MRGLAAAVCLLLAVSVHPAWAQTRRPTRNGPEIDVGGFWIDGGSYGSADANLTTPAGTPKPLFSVATRLRPEIAMHANFAVHVAGPLRAELSGTWGQATLHSNVTGDLEGAAPVTVSDKLKVITVQGAGVVSLARHSRVEPYVRVGFGWMRELTIDDALAGDGTIASAGVGVKYWGFERDHGLFKRFGLRSEARAVGRLGGLELGTKRRLISPAVGVSAIIGF
jgi:hypothetical protein